METPTCCRGGSAGEGEEWRNWRGLCTAAAAAHVSGPGAALCSPQASNQSHGSSNPASRGRTACGGSAGSLVTHSAAGAGGGAAACRSTLHSSACTTAQTLQLSAHQRLTLITANSRSNTWGVTSPLASAAGAPAVMAPAERF